MMHKLVIVLLNSEFGTIAGTITSWIDWREGAGIILSIVSFLTTPECVETEGIKKKFFLFTGHTAGHACRLKCYWYWLCKQRTTRLIYHNKEFTAWSH